MIETALAVRLPAGANFCYSSTLSYHRSAWSSEDVARGVHVSGSCRLLHCCGSNTHWKRSQRLNNGSLLRRNNLRKNSIQASAEHLGSASDPVKPNGRLRYHPSEELAKSISENAEDVRLTAAETTRTIIEVNSKATLMFAGLINDEVQENIIWPELPYVTDESGSTSNIYFQVKNTEEALQNLTSENNFVQLLIGIDTMEMINEMELFGPSEVDFGFEEIDDEGADFEEDDDNGDDEDDTNDEADEADDADDEYDTDWVSVIEDEDDHNHSDETLGDWAKLDTMRSSHPMHFANKLAEVASDDPVDWMEQPPATIVIQGILRPAFSEEHTVIQRHLSSHHSSNADINEVQELEDKNLENHGRINCHESGSSKEDLNLADRLNEDISSKEASFFRLEIIKIQLFTGHAHPITVEVEDVIKAQPDAIAHTAGKIMSRLRAGGENITQALKSLCWRGKGIQVEEVAITGIDSLGFDVRACSGTQVQTLRFAFDTRATSEYSAERLLNDLLFPRIHPKSQRTKQI